MEPLANPIVPTLGCMKLQLHISFSTVLYYCANLGETGSMSMRAGCSVDNENDLFLKNQNKDIGHGQKLLLS